MQASPGNETLRFTGEDMANSITHVLVRDPATGESVFQTRAEWVTGVRVSSAEPFIPDSVRSAMKLPLRADRAYREADAAMYSRYAAAAYCVASGKDITNWSCKACKELPKTTDVQLFRAMPSQTMAFAGYIPSAKTVIVSFSGTDPLNVVNWITDLNFIKRDFPLCQNCEVHRGFAAAFDDVKTPLRAYVHTLLGRYPGSVVAVTGHSLGAALASHAIIDFFQAGMPLAFPQYQFGGPRVGNGPFAAYFYNNFGQYGLYRLVHWKDPVAQLPPYLFGFTHPPAEVWYQADQKSFKVCAGNTGEDKSCSYTDLPWIVPDAVYHLNYLFDYTMNYLSCKL